MNARRRKETTNHDQSKVIAPNGAEDFQGEVDNGEMEKEQASSSEAENQPLSDEDADESGGEGESKDTSEGQPESVKDREFSGGGECRAAESTNVENDGEFGGEWTTNRMKKTKRVPVGLEEGGTNTPTPSCSEQQFPASSGEAPQRAGRAPKAKQATRCLPRIRRHLFSRHPSQLAGRVMSQRERTHRCFRRGDTT